MNTLDELTDAMNALGEAGEEIGFGSELFDITTEIYEDLSNGMEAWAKNCQTSWKENAPWQTGNLRSSIDYEINLEELKAWVGVNVDKLLSVAGQDLPFKRVIYKLEDGETISSQEQFNKYCHRKHHGMPDYDYTLYADGRKQSPEKGWGAKSAGGKGARGVSDYPPERAQPTPFIEAIWFELAKKEKAEIF